nr:hypothetical protein [Tanacetum cinerariifolium]
AATAGCVGLLLIAQKGCVRFGFVTRKGQTGVFGFNSLKRVFVSLYTAPTRAFGLAEKRIGVFGTGFNTYEVNTIKSAFGVTESTKASTRAFRLAEKRTGVFETGFNTLGVRLVGQKHYKDVFIYEVNTIKGAFGVTESTKVTPRVRLAVISTERVHLDLKTAATAGCVGLLLIAQKGCVRFGFVTRKASTRAFRLAEKRTGVFETGFNTLGVRLVGQKHYKDVFIYEVNTIKGAFGVTESTK